MDFQTLVAKADEAIARSNAIILQAIADNIILKATSIDDNQERINKYFKDNGII